MKTVLNIGKLIGLNLLVILSNVAPMIMIGMQGQLTEAIKWSLSLLYLVLVITFIYTLAKAYGLRFEGPKIQYGWKDFGVTCLYFLAGRVVAIGGTFLNQFLTGHETTANDAGLLAVGANQSSIFPFFILLFVLAIGIFGPILEELVFRGFATLYFFKGRSLIAATVVTSLIFGINHVTSLVELPIYFLMGILLYLSYRRRDQLVDSIVFHILNNLPAALVLGFVLFQK